MFSLLSCWQDVSNSASSDSTTQSNTEYSVSATTWETVSITLNWTSITSDSSNVEINWSVATIISAWTYEISWTLSDGQIVVDADKDDEVNIILSWVNITNSTSSAILVEKAWETTITLASGTTNTVTDGDNYETESSDEEDSDANATIFSKDDLIINWGWILIVNANYNDWITGKDTLVIESWVITVNSVDDGIRWKDSLTINGWTIDVTCAWDSLKSDNEEEGTIIINSWDITISAWDDAVHAEISLTVNDGNIDITKSYEWLESTTITINWGNIDLVSSDDWLNAASWDFSESGMMWWGWMWDMWWGRGWFGWGTPPTDMTDTDSTDRPTPPDWNNADSTDTTDFTQMTPPDMTNTTWTTTSTSSVAIYINWWVINIDAGWDWVDANWSITMTWWEVYVNGPTNSWNWAVDYDSSFNISWWIFMASWSSWMAQNVSSSSSQNAVLIWYSSSIEAWVKFTLVDSSGNEVISFTNTKTASSIVISSPDLETWETYTYYLDWVEQETFTISSVTTSVWTIGWWMWWGMWRNR